jgi:hypothetical protein
MWQKIMYSTWYMINRSPHVNHLSAMRLITFLAAVLFISFTLPVNAANVRPFGKTGIIIEGTIIQGDYAKLVALLDKTGSTTDRVSIYSNGGSVFEAIKIGTLIRNLRLRTIAPSGFGSRGNMCTGIANQNNCTCLSACVLVFAAGIHHYGNVLGMHRSYVSHDFPKGMGVTPGLNTSEQLKYTVSDYLKKMEFPQQFIDTMNATHSKDMTLLKDSEINRYLSGYIPQFSEKVMAKCGNWNESMRRYDQLEKKRRSSGLSTSEQQQHSALLTANTRTFPQCQQAAEKSLREEVFNRVMKEARKNASNRHISI